MKIRQRLLRQIALSVFTIIVIATAAVAQSAALGKIAGVVKDQAGAGVSGAEVSLVHSQGVRRTALTGADGRFAFDNVAPGSYAVIVTRSGFGPYKSVVEATPGTRKELSVELEINPLSEEVTVTAEAGRVSEARGLAQPVNVVNEGEILQRGTEVVAQVVDEEQGVNLQRTSPSLSAVFVRGLTGRNVAVYVDGVRYTTSAQRGGVGTFLPHRTIRP